MRAMIWRDLRSGKAGRSWETLVGFDLATLQRHIERQFVPGMTWQNIGQWHVDHIVPLKAFTFSTAEDADFRAAWALSNLRPLWAQDNLKKQAARTHLL